MLTLGQASCLVLDLQMTNENREIAKKTMKESPFGVTYIYGTSYLEPAVIAKSIIEKNTYKYQHYPETPPGSPSLDSIKNEIEIVDDKDGSVKTATSSASSAAAVNYSMESILDTAKYIFTKHDPNNDELYDSDFLTNDQVYIILSLTFPRLQYVYSPRQFSLLLNKHKDHFGVLTQKKVSGSKVPIRGRLLYILKKSVQENLNVNKKCFKRHIQNSDGEWINIGYVRKSPTNESNETRERLIQKMVSKLINISFCEKIYVSPCTNVQDPVFKRDFKDDEKMYGDGNTQGKQKTFMSVHTLWSLLVLTIVLRFS